MIGKAKRNTRFMILASLPVVVLLALLALKGSNLLGRSSASLGPDRLVKVQKSLPPDRDQPILGAEFLAWRDQSQTLDQIAVYTSRALPLTGEAPPERVFCGQVSADFFNVLKSSPLLGRVFVADEYRPARSHVVVVSRDLWSRRFSGDRALLGKSLTLDRQNYTVVGVMPPDLQIPERCEIWMPLALDDEGLRSKNEFFELNAIARLKPQVTLDQGQTEMNTIARDLEPRSVRARSEQTIKLLPLHK